MGGEVSLKRTARSNPLAVFHFPETPMFRDLNGFDDQGYALRELCAALLIVCALLGFALT